METKYTTGPWRVTIYGGFDAPRVWSDDGSIALIQHHESGPQEGEANARLIAAAPELLGACVAMIEWDEREKDHAVDFHARMALCDAAFQKARAAIAKAGGR